MGMTMKEFGLKKIDSTQKSQDKTNQSIPSSRPISEPEGGMQDEEDKPKARIRFADEDGGTAPKPGYAYKSAMGSSLGDFSVQEVIEGYKTHDIDKDLPERK
jgi:hypothetical protein